MQHTAQFFDQLFSLTMFDLQGGPKVEATASYCAENNIEVHLLQYRTKWFRRFKDVDSRK